MRYYLCVAMLTMFAADALAQPDAAVGDLPPEAQQADAGDPAQAAPGGGAPNVMFAAIDADGDGVLTRQELRKAFAALKKLDADGDGNITLAEVSGGATPAGAGDAAQLVERMLQNDKNGDGKLTPEEVPQDMLPMLQNADRNGDGALDRAELTAVAENMQQFRGGPAGPGVGRDGRRADAATGHFMRHDRNNDGVLSAAEIPPQLRNAFRPEDDLNKDGAIDPAELQAVIARMGGAARAVRAGGDPNTFRDPNRRNIPRPGNQN